MFSKKDNTRKNEEKKQDGEVSRRDFLVGAGTVLAASTIGGGLLAGCKGETTTETVEVTKTKTATQTVEVPTTIISTVDGSGSVVTTTKTVTASASTSTTTPTITDGTYSGTMKGMGGNVTVTLTYANGKITDCDIVGEDETEGVGGRAIKIMPTKFIVAGDINVDGVSGATVTSTAILKAARIAYNKSLGGSASPIKMKPGTYIGSARGHSSAGELAVNVTVSEDRIVSIERWDKVDTHETEVIVNSVFDRMVPRIIENQSLLVDSVCGATHSSSAVRNATENALGLALAAGGSDEWAILNFYELPEKPGLGKTETIDVDLVIVGAGNSGIMCATSAVETYKKQTGKDLKVLLVEKAGKIGGTACLTHMPFAVNPPRLKAEKNKGEDWIKDVPKLREKWLNWNMRPDGTQPCKPELVDLYIAESGNTIDWLWYEHGWTFGLPGVDRNPDNLNPVSTAPGAFNYVGSNINFELRRPVVDLWLKAMISDFIEPAGGSVMLETEAYEILYDQASGSAIGVKARNNVEGTEYVINAKAVVTATGGYAGNSERTKKWQAENKFYPKYADENWHLTGMYQNDGAMIEAAINIGADTWNIGALAVCADDTVTPSEMFVYPINVRPGKYNLLQGRLDTWSLNEVPYVMMRLPSVLAVDRDGERMCNEKYTTSSAEGSMCVEIIKYGSRFYSILDKAQIDTIAQNGIPANTFMGIGYFGVGGVLTATPIPEMDEVLENAIKAGMVFKSDTIAELADKIGANPSTLVETVNRYNELCDKGTDDDFQKPATNLIEVKTGPFYAITGCIQPFHIPGGLNIDTQLRVLRADDHETPIYGLYAICGDSANVLYSDYRTYAGGGMAQGWTVHSGRLGGISVGEYIANKS